MFDFTLGTLGWTDLTNVRTIHHRQYLKSSVYAIRLSVIQMHSYLYWEEQWKAKCILRFHIHRPLGFIKASIDAAIVFQSLVNTEDFEGCL